MGFFGDLATMVTNPDVALMAVKANAFVAKEQVVNSLPTVYVKKKKEEETEVEKQLDIVISNDDNKKKEPIKEEAPVINKKEESKAENSFMDDIKEFVTSLENKDQIPTEVLDAIRTLGEFSQNQKEDNKGNTQLLSELPADTQPKEVNHEPVVTGMDFSPLQQGVTYAGQPQEERPLKEVTLQNVETAIAADKAKIASAEKAKVTAKRSNNKPLVSPANGGVIIDA